MKTLRLSRLQKKGAPCIAEGVSVKLLDELMRATVCAAANPAQTAAIPQISSAASRSAFCN